MEMATGIKYRQRHLMTGNVSVAKVFRGTFILDSHTAVGIISLLL